MAPIASFNIISEDVSSTFYLLAGWETAPAAAATVGPGSKIFLNNPFLSYVGGRVNIPKPINVCSDLQPGQGNKYA